MISKAYGMAPPQGGASSGGIGSVFIPFIVMIVIFYFLLIRPQKKKEQAHLKFLSELKKGDEVVTQSGIYGRIAGVAEKAVTLEIANQVKIKVAKSSIAAAAQAPQAEG